jgi:VCBS repeat-containing protein
MFRSKRNTLIVLALVALALIAIPQALAAQSHLDAHCDFGEVVDVTSENGDVSRVSSGQPYPMYFLGLASASRLKLQGDTSASALDGELRYCDGRSGFTNAVEIQPGGSGLSAGDPVTLALTVSLDGEVSASVSGPPTEGPIEEYQALGDVDATLHVTAPDRPECNMEDGKEYCKPAEIAHFGAWGFRLQEDGAGHQPGSLGSLFGAYSWNWWLTSNRGGEQGDQGEHEWTCEWYEGGPDCLVSNVPPPQTPDYRGTRTILVDAFVGDRLQLEGWLSVAASARHGYASASVPSLAGSGFQASLAPASGFEGLNLSYEQAPASADQPPTCAPVSAQTAEDTPLQTQLSCDDESPSTLSYVLTTGPAHGQVVLTSDGHYTYTPAENFNGQDSFQVTATDAGGKLSSPATVTVTVNPVNDRPVCSAKSAFATVGQTAQLDAACDDVDRDPLTIAIAGQGTKGTATVNGLEIDYTPTQAGTDSFTYTASDGTLTSQPATVTVNNLAAPGSLTMSVTQGLVVFRKPPDDDRARFTGTFASSEPVTCNEDVTVTLNASVFAQTVPGSAFQAKNKGKLCVYTRLGAGGTGGIKRLELNLATNTFLVNLRDEVELSPLTNPVTLGLGIGSLSTTQTIQMKQAKNRWTYPS